MLRKDDLPIINLSERLNIHYLEHNPSGNPTVLLLHGLGANGSSWTLQIPSLTQAGYRVIAPDARGFGESSFPGGRHLISDMANDMFLLLKVLITGPTHIVGISMGGTIALQLAIDYPQVVEKLVLVNAFATLRPDRPSLWLYYTLRYLLVYTLGLPTQARSVSRKIFPKPGQEELRYILIEQILQANPAGYRATMQALGIFNITKKLGDIQAPTLVITAENDTTVPPNLQATLVVKIPHVRQYIISNSGHAVTIDQPETFNKVLLDFLSGQMV